MVLHRPIETTAVIRKVEFQVAGKTTTQEFELPSCFNTWLRYFCQAAWPPNNRTSSSAADPHKTGSRLPDCKSGGSSFLCSGAERIGTESSIAGSMTMSPALATSKMKAARLELKPRTWKAQPVKLPLPSNPLADNSTSTPSGNV